MPLRNFFEKRRIRRIFGQAVNPEAVESLFRDDGAQPTFKSGRLEFVLAFVRGQNPAEVSILLGRIGDLAAGQGAEVNCMLGPLVVMLFRPAPTAPTHGNRSTLVAALHDQMATDLKIVHGAAEGHHGLFGSGNQLSYTFLVPKFDEVLGMLSRLEFGQVKEFQP